MAAVSGEGHIWHAAPLIAVVEIESGPKMAPGRSWAATSKRGDLDPTGTGTEASEAERDCLNEVGFYSTEQSRTARRTGQDGGEQLTAPANGEQSLPPGPSPASSIVHYRLLASGQTAVWYRSLLFRPALPLSRCGTADGQIAWGTSNKQRLAALSCRAVLCCRVVPSAHSLISEQRQRSASNSVEERRAGAAIIARAAGPASGAIPVGRDETHGLECSTGHLDLLGGGSILRFRSALHVIADSPIRRGAQQPCKTVGPCPVRHGGLRRDGCLCQPPGGGRRRRRRRHAVVSRRPGRWA